MLVQLLFIITEKNLNIYHYLWMYSYFYTQKVDFHVFFISKSSWDSIDSFIASADDDDVLISFNRKDTGNFVSLYKQP